MPVYSYVALDAKGRKRKGIIEAASASAARQKLRDQDVYPTEVVESAPSGEKETAAGTRGVGELFSRIRLSDVAVMTRQLSTLLGAGLPLVPSLTVLIAQTRQPLLKTVLAQIKDSVNEGNSLTVSMTAFPKIFPPFYINMARAGEASGTLNTILERLADYYENQQALKTKIRSALAYPVLMFFIGGAVLLFLVSFVVPNITKIFQDMNQGLPAITVFLIAVSGFLKSFWWMVVGGAVVAALALRHVIRKTDWGQYGWDRFKLALPFLGTISQKMAVARFSRTLGTLLKSDVPLLNSLDIVSSIVNNRLIADEVRKTAHDVEEGQPLSAPLARSGLFPPMTIELVAVGEQSGTLEKMLFRIADAYEREVEADILILTSLLEPVMILSMGLLVGFIVVSILLPIFEMNQLVR
jgi:general secretion pathway protein F